MVMDQVRGNKLEQPISTLLEVDEIGVLGLASLGRRVMEDIQIPNHGGSYGSGSTLS